MDNFFLNRDSNAHGITLGPITRPHGHSTSSSSPESSSSYFIQSKSCDSCKEATYMSRCQDCQQNLCESCYRAHQRVRITSDHRIVFISEDVVNMPDSVTISGALNNHQFESTARGLSRFFSRDVHQLSSNIEESIPNLSKSSSEEKYIPFTDEAMKFAREQTDKVMTRVNLAREKICREMDILQYRKQITEQNCYKQASQIQFSFERCIAITQRRQAELLKSVEDFRAFESSSNAKREAFYQQCLANVLSVSDYLTDASKLTSVPDIIDKNKKANSELEVVAKVLTATIPNEAVAVLHMPIEPLILPILNNMGGITTTSYLNPMLNQDLGKCTMRGRPILGSKSLVFASKSNCPTFVMGAGGILCRPWGLCCDRHGNIIVADRSHNRILTFKPDGSITGNFGKLGSSPGEFNRPAGVTVDLTDRLLVVDKDNHRIQIFTLTGNFLLQFGAKGSSNGEFNYPWDIAVNTSGTIVVSDTRNHRIQLFDSEGRFLRKYGFDTPTMFRAFESPRGVCFAPDGEIVITDFNTHRIVILARDFTRVQRIGMEGSGNSEFFRPQGVICDDKGQILVADSRNNRIQIFNLSGKLLGIIGQAGKGVGQMDRPSGIAVTLEGRIAVVDFGNDRVQIF